jgi:hypothetical protein
MHNKASSAEGILAGAKPPLNTRRDLQRLRHVEQVAQKTYQRNMPLGRSKNTSRKVKIYLQVLT